MRANHSGQLAVFVQVVEIEDPAETIFDGAVQQQREGHEQVFEANGAGVAAIDVSEEKDRVTVAF